MAASDVWGTVPAWVSAIATSVAFTWALVLYALSRRRERIAVAQAVYCRLDRQAKQVVVHNLSGAPIAGLAVYVTPPPTEVPGAPAWLAAGGYAELDVEFDLHRAGAAIVEFTDSVGRRWQRTSALRLRSGGIGGFRRQPATLGSKGTGANPSSVTASGEKGPNIATSAEPQLAIEPQAETSLVEAPTLAPARSRRWRGSRGKTPRE